MFQHQSRKNTKRTASTSLQDQVKGLIALFSQGQFDKALKHGERLAKKHPNVLPIHDILGAVNVRLGRLEQAVARYQKVLQLKPDYAEAHNNLGITFNDLEKHEKAIASYQEALRIKPDYAEAHNNLGVALNELDKHEEAIVSYKESLRLSPNYAEAHNNLGVALSTLGEYEEAITSYQKAISIKPNYADGFNNLGGLYKFLGKSREAIESLAKALQLDPTLYEAHNNLGFMHNENGMHDRALACCKKALELKPDFIAAHNNLGYAYMGLGMFDDATDSLDKAVALDSENAETLCAYGTLYTGLGRKDEALSKFSDAIRINPDYAKAHYSVSLSKKYTADDPQLTQMQALIKKLNPGTNDYMTLNFALSKAYRDIGQTADAFECLSAANHLKKAWSGYEIEEDHKLFDQIRWYFDALSANHSATHLGQENLKQPLFVVGMPRSGTTLVEQILASHSNVYGAGELEILNKMAHSDLWSARKGLQNPADNYEPEKLKQKYLAELDRYNVPEKFITDKNPLNFRWIGFIATAFPDAKIVNLNRDPRATCWSIYNQNFSSTGNGYANSLSDVGEYYNLYGDLMSFWRDKFPNRIYDLNYEAMTENQEDETRKLLGYCGLEWEDQCLNFFETSRSVRTASVWQVRKKMYKGSSDEWRKYEKFLEPLINALDC